VFLLKPSPLPTYESMELVAGTCEIFAKSAVVEPICVQADSMFYGTVTKATKFSNKINADYMVYMDLSKSQGVYWYHAELVRPAAGMHLATYSHKWKAEPAATQETWFTLASRIIFRSLGKITVNITIESSPSYCDVYRDDIHLGDTGKDGFRNTYYLEKGSYKIKLCKPEYKDEEDTLKVEKNPTNYLEKFTLKRK